jgi:hypothetical protein
LKQKLYDKALTIGLQGYAQLYVHQELPRFWVCMNLSFYGLLIGKASKRLVG